jgi:redox-sensitive bicupin YhaK (pirin superfamily)
MSGPVEVADLPDTEPSVAPGPVVEVTKSRLAQVGDLEVRRALPNRGRRTVGAWCFADHFGPAEVSERLRPDIGPHRHVGLQTVTWLLAGELVHHDSLGSEQPIRPGQLNLMTVGHGVAHAEEATDGFKGPIHGLQLWVAQPSATRNGSPAFEHHPELPRVELGAGDATVLIGELAAVSSPARRDTAHVGADLALRAGTVIVPLDPGFEHALVVAEGTLTVEGATHGPGELVYLGAGRDELHLAATGPSRALLFGGEPFAETLLMWWNFVARTHDEIDAAYDDWSTDSGRFGQVPSRRARIDTRPPPWRSPTN